LSSGKQTGMPPHFGFVSKLMSSSIAVVEAENNRNSDANGTVDLYSCFWRSTCWNSITVLTGSLPAHEGVKSTKSRGFGRWR
jgi:hypothetical protein